MWNLSSANVDDRVRNSEKFPRIRDAEKQMRENSAMLKKAYDDDVEYKRDPVKGEEKKRKLRREKKREDARLKLLESSLLEGGGSLDMGSVNGALGSVSPTRSVATAGVNTNASVASDNMSMETGIATHMAQLGAPPKQFFSTFVLNSDPEMAPFVDYSLLHFPKLFNEEEIPPDSIDTLWMSGFLDRAERDGAELLKKKKAKMLSKVKVSLDVADPRNSVDLQNNNKKSSLDENSSVENESQSSATVTSASVHTKLDELESMRGKGAKSGKNMSSLATKLSKQNNNNNNKDGNKESSLSKSMSSSSILERRKAKKEPKPFKLTLEQKLKPYELTVKEEILREKKVKPPEFVRFVSDELETYFDNERKEYNAALRLQKFWRKSKALIPWRYAVLCMRMAVRIQKIARGMITRVWVARWYNRRNTVVTMLQSKTRMMLSNKRTRPRLALEQEAAKTIQRFVRGRTGRKKWKLAQYDVAALHIQCLWRGVVARARADRKWLDRMVIPLQTQARRMVAMKNVKILKKEADAAALIIQKKFRTFCAIKRMTEALAKRDMRYRVDQILVLASEEEEAQERLEKLTMRLLKRNFKEEAIAASKTLFARYEEIRKWENDYIEYTRQREILSPRALMQGWIQDLDKNAYESREEVTRLKFQCLFEDLMKVHQIDHHLNEKVEEIENVAALRNRIAAWRDQEIDERREKVTWTEIREARKKRRAAIGDEKRKWMVRFYTSDGKPDRKRRPGRKWDKEVYAGPEKQVYTPTVDLMAFVNDKKSTMRAGSEESVNATIDQMALQTYLEGQRAYEQILNPIANIMQEVMGAPPQKRAPQNLGWGPVGETLAPAMWTIGATPQEWAKPLTPRGTHVMTEKQIREAEIQRATERALAKQAKADMKRKAKMDLANQSNEGGGGGGEGEGGNSSEQQLQVYQKQQQQQSINLEDDEDSTLNEEEEMLLMQHKVNNNTLSREDRIKMLQESVKGQRNNLKGAAALQAEAMLKSEVAEIRRDFNKMRAKKRAAKPKTSQKIPWALLDELEAEKKKWESERAIVEFHEQQMRKRFEDSQNFNRRR